MTTDPNWLKSLTESYKQEVSESARNLQEEADQIMNLVETIQTALNVDLTEEQVDALIEAFRSTVNPETGEHKAGLLRNIWTRVGGSIMSSKNDKKQSKIHGEIDTHNDDIDRQNTEIEGKNKEEQSAHDRDNEASRKNHALLTPRDTSSLEDVTDYYNDEGHRRTKKGVVDPDGSYEKRVEHEKKRKELETEIATSRARLTPKIPETDKRVKGYYN